MRWTPDDGGRKAAGYKPSGDCVTRALAVAMGKPYAEVRAAMRQGQSGIRRTRKTSSKLDPGSGVYTKRLWFKEWMAREGWEFIPTMGIGTGCRVHLKAGELPGGRLIVVVSRHYTAVVDGVIHDTHDPSRGGTRCVYGYWRKR